MQNEANTIGDTVNVRFALTADVNDIAEIHVKSWQAVYKNSIPAHILRNLSTEKRAKQWEMLLQQGNTILVIEKDHKILGFASICVARDADLDPATCGEISAFYLHPESWRKGFGRILCNRVLHELGKQYDFAFLWVLESNWQARGFYESMGFRSTGIHKIDIYEGSELEELRYMKELSSSSALK